MLFFCSVYAFCWIASIKVHAVFRFTSKQLLSLLSSHTTKHILHRSVIHWDYLKMRNSCQCRPCQICCSVPHQGVCERVNAETAPAGNITGTIGALCPIEWTEREGEHVHNWPDIPWGPAIATREACNKIDVFTFEK